MANHDPWVDTRPLLLDPAAPVVGKPTSEFHVPPLPTRIYFPVQRLDSIVDYLYQGGLIKISVQSPLWMRWCECAIVAVDEMVSKSPACPERDQVSKQAFCHSTELLGRVPGPI